MIHPTDSLLSPPTPPTRPGDDRLRNASDTPPPPQPAPRPTTTAVLELRIQHQTDAITHLTRLFTQHGLNLDAIICVPQPGGAQSRLLLLICDEPRLAEIPALLNELPDVLALRHRRDLTPEFFLWMDEMAAAAQPLAE